ncbi:MAG: hypothetical protein JSR47_01150 [Proteobacteria bacterium]|nr:hypothetical protein [Pseudomonadota bacterium]
MKNQGLTFADRLETAAKAKQALLDKARAKDPANDPEFAARQAARLEAARQREQREAEKREARLAEQARVKAEREAEAARKAAEAEAEAERIRAGKRPVSKPALSPAEQKAIRDARYAARKARKGKK